MSTGYIRNDTSDNIANGNIINSSDLDGEFNAIQAAFDLASGHQHDGTTGNGAPIITLGSNQEFVATSDSLRPKNDNTLDLGTAILEFKNLYLDGVANVDTLQVDENATITGDLSVQGNTTLGNANTNTITLTGRFVSTPTPGVDDTYDLGTSSLQWRNLEIDGIASIDTLQVDENASVTGTLGVTGVTTLGNMTATMTGGTVNGTIIGGTAAAAGTFTTLTATAGTITGITDLAVADGGTGASNRLQGLGSLLGYTTTATAAGTTTLTNSSSPVQYFTGTTTQTVVLPSAVNALPGATYFIYNNSTGNLTVNANNAALLCTITTNEIWNITCNSSTGTTPTSWTATKIRSEEYADFATRSAFVTWASGKTPAVGTVIQAAGLSYRYIGSGTAISDLAGWVPDGQPYLTHWPYTLAGLQAAVLYCEGGTLKIPAGTFAYTLTASLPLNNTDNIVIEGEGQGIANLTFTHGLNFMQVIKGTNITIRNLSITMNCTFVGVSNTAFLAYFNNKFLMDRCDYTTDADITLTKNHHIAQFSNSAVDSDEIAFTNNRVDGISYFILKSNASLATCERVRFHGNRVTRGIKEPLGINSPEGAVSDVIITDNICDNHLAGEDATDGHWIGVSDAKNVIITGNILSGNTREAIHIENAAESLVISDNVMAMDFTGLTATGFISVLQGLLGAGGMCDKIVITDNIMRQTSGIKEGFGVWVYDFTSGLQKTSAKNIIVHGNIVENCEFGFDIMGGGETGNTVSGNIATECKVGFLNRFENQITYQGNTSNFCDYGVATYALGRFVDHKFNQCTNLVGSKGAAAAVAALEGFSVIKADRDFAAASTFDYALAGGFDASARSSMSSAVVMHGLSQTTYIHKTMLADWDGTTLTSTAGISRAVNATATLSVVAGVLTATVGVTLTQANCRFSVTFDGTALLSAAVIP